VRTERQPDYAWNYFLKGENQMIDKNVSRFTARRFRVSSFLLALLLASTLRASSQDDKKIETIDAVARGTSTQLGKTVSIKITIFQYSTPEDRKVLVDAFSKGQHQGLVKALSDMKSVGRIAIPGTVGYDLSYIALVPTPTGRKIRFAANRRIAIGEAYYNTQSQSFDLTAGEIDLNDKETKKSTGVLYPASQLIINKKGELQFELRQNPWTLVNIIDWNGAGSKE
jgi:hypothetical protein